MDRFEQVNVQLEHVCMQVSFMHRFWEAADAELRAQLKRAVEAGQWEVATGGWVMTDEASPTAAMMLEQLVEGHQWLAQHFDSALVPFISLHCSERSSAIRVQYEVQ